jgi:hypothetical protein
VGRVCATIVVYVKEIFTQFSLNIWGSGGDDRTTKGTWIECQLYLTLSDPDLGKQPRPAEVLSITIYISSLLYQCDLSTQRFQEVTHALPFENILSLPRLAEGRAAG